MSLGDSTRAIGSVSELLKNRLIAGTGINPVLVGRPEAARTGGANRFNLFLYRLSFDGHMRNVPVDTGQKPPLWMVLHYLLTAFDENDESDSKIAHELLGRGVTALHHLNFIRPEPSDVALNRNPEPLKLTFDDADPELLSKIMQGTDEKYRISTAFQVRPVMLADDSPPAYAPAVKTVGPPGSEGVVVLPGLGARLDAIDPERFVSGQQIELTGTDLAGYDQVLIGATSLPAAASPSGGLTTTVPPTIAAGAYPICVARTLPSGRKRTSNAVLGHLLPVVTAVAKIAPLSVPALPAAQTLRFGSFTISGSQLGGPDASIFAALYRNGAAKLLLEPPGGTATQLTFAVTGKQAIEQGPYRVILRVNSEQATESLELDWT